MEIFIRGKISNNASSPLPGHCDPLCEEVPLLLKLRGYFAKFLRESCLTPLGILYLPTLSVFGTSTFLLKVVQAFPGIDEDNEGLKELRNEWGETIYMAVTVALLEMEEYNPSGFLNFGIPKMIEKPA
ncbi:hypothetical protein Gotur_020478 [Gossypium turneri]